jgi:hypothetical protein
MRWLVILSSLLPALHGQDTTYHTNNGGNDPCVQLHFEPSFHAAKACLSSFPFNQTLFAHTMTSISRTLPLLVFLESAKRPPDQHFVHRVPLQTRFKDLWNTRWQNDWSWQEALSSLMQELFDGHASYTPQCYRKIQFRQPFMPTAAVAQDGTTRIFVGGVLSSVPQDAVHVGREILEMDGVPAVVALWRYAQTSVGKYKDQFTRFSHVVSNVAWTQKGWAVNGGSFQSPSRMPQQPSVMYRLAAGNGRPEEVVHKAWLVKLPTFTDSKDYWRRYCVKTPTLKKKKGGEDEEYGPYGDPHDVDVLHDVRYHPGQQRQELTSPFTAMQRAQPLVQSHGIAFFRSTMRPDVGILKLTTFGNLTKPAAKQKWRQTIATIIQGFEQNGIHKLILDLSTNGGGNPCLATELSYALFGNDQQPFPTVRRPFRKDMRLAPLLNKMVQTAYRKKLKSSKYYPGSMTSSTTNRRYRGLELIRPPRMRQTPHKQVEYSNFFRDGCPKGTNNPLERVRSRLTSKDVVVLSDGRCGSACGRLYYTLKEGYGVRAAVTGYFAHVPRTVSAFPATSVHDLDGLLKDLGKLGMSSDPLAPKRLLVNSKFRYPARESYSNDYPNLPLEYLYTPSDFTLDWDAANLMRPCRTWDQLARLAF